MTQVKPVNKPMATAITAARSVVGARIDELSPSIRTDVNKVIHDNPELLYKEYIAHDTLAGFLENKGYQVTRGAHGIETCFQAEYGSGGRLVIFCAEYDALPGIGHACGHNLVATASISAFLGAAHALKELNIPGRVRILGTPAEEGGGGKIKLIENGAFNPPESIAAAFMVHPMQSDSLSLEGFDGLAGWRLIASEKVKVEFRGKTAHAAGDPWNGINALDAAVNAYNSISVMRQQIRPNERIHGVFENGGAAPNVIPDYTRMAWCVRGPTVKRSGALLERVKRCFEAGAAAAGCEVNYIPDRTYKDLRVNPTLSDTYVEEMAFLGQKVMAREAKPKAFGSTDMGNVSYEVPSLHGAFVIPAPCACHNLDFAASAGTDHAHGIATTAAKGMAMLGMRVIVDDAVADGSRREFEAEDEED